MFYFRASFNNGDIFNCRHGVDLFLLEEKHAGTTGGQMLLSAITTDEKGAGSETIVREGMFIAAAVLAPRFTFIILFL